MDLFSLRKNVNSLLADYSHAKRKVREEKESLSQAKERLRDAEEAQALVQRVAQGVQEQVHSQIASVVTRCLETVFQDQAYQFQIKFLKRRGRTEAELVFLRDGQEFSPTEECGGGVVDLASFALRLSCMMLLRPRVRRFLALDEPFRFLSQEYQPKVRELLETLSKELGLQVIIVTHSPDLATGKVVEL